MLNCEETEPELGAYLDGELTPQERAIVDAHLVLCERCNAALNQLELARKSLTALPKLSASVQLAAKIHSAVLAEPRQSASAVPTPIQTATIPALSDVSTSAVPVPKPIPLPRRQFSWPAVASAVAAIAMVSLMGFVMVHKGRDSRATLARSGSEVRVPHQELPAIQPTELPQSQRPDLPAQTIEQPVLSTRILHPDPQLQPQVIPGRSSEQSITDSARRQTENLPTSPATNAAAADPRDVSLSNDPSSKRAPNAPATAERERIENKGARAEDDLGAGEVRNAARKNADKVAAPASSSPAPAPVPSAAPAALSPGKAATLSADSNVVAEKSGAATIDAPAKKVDDRARPMPKAPMARVMVPPPLTSTLQENRLRGAALSEQNAGGVSAADAAPAKAAVGPVLIIRTPDTARAGAKLREIAQQFNADVALAFPTDKDGSAAPRRAPSPTFKSKHVEYTLTALPQQRSAMLNQLYALQAESLGYRAAPGAPRLDEAADLARASTRTPESAASSAGTGAPKTSVDASKELQEAGKALDGSDPQTKPAATPFKTNSADGTAGITPRAPERLIIKVELYSE